MEHAFAGVSICFHSLAKHFLASSCACFRGRVPSGKADQSKSTAPEGPLHLLSGLQYRRRTELFDPGLLQLLSVFINEVQTINGGPMHTQLNLWTIASIVLAGSLFLGATQNAPDVVGRFQLVSAHQTTMFLIDTTNGRTWRYSHRTEAQGTSVNSPCLGLKDCFMEVDRASFTPKGWVSELESVNRSSVSP